MNTHCGYPITAGANVVTIIYSVNILQEINEGKCYFFVKLCLFLEVDERRGMKLLLFTKPSSLPFGEGKRGGLDTG